MPIDANSSYHTASAPVLLGALEEYTIKFVGMNGLQLHMNDYVFFVPNSTATCPPIAPPSYGGYLTEELSTQVTLPKIDEEYVLCLRSSAPDDQSLAMMHRNVRALVGADLVSMAPQASPPRSPLPPGRNSNSV